MKVLHIIPYIGDEASGPANCIPPLCTSLQNKGCEIILRTLNPLPDKKFNFSCKGFERSNFPHPSFGRSPGMFSKLNHEAPSLDLVHNHSLWMAPNIYAGLISKKFDIPLVCTPHGTMSKTALKRSVWKKKLALILGQKMTLENTSCFHATAQHEVQDIKAYCPNKSVSKISNGIDIPQLTTFARVNRRKLLFLGRIHPIKGIENLIGAWSQLEDKYPKWDLDIVGIGDVTYKTTLLKQIKSLNLNRVKIQDPVFGEAKNVVYQKADLYVLPSYSENFGMTVAESLANATPVITTSETPWHDLEKYECGWCIPVGIEILTSTLENAFEKTPNELAHMGNRGRAWMQKDFSWDSIAKEMIATYQWILTKKNKPKCIVHE